MLNRTLLLVGPNGAGKTLVARLAAAQLQAAGQPAIATSLGAVARAVSFLNFTLTGLAAADILKAGPAEVEQALAIAEAEVLAAARHQNLHYDPVTGALLLGGTTIPSAIYEAPAIRRHEDSALKAYAETRIRYLGSVPASAAFNQIGEALPTIILNGQVIGLWHWDKRTQRIKTKIFAHSVTPHQRQEINQQAKQLTAVLCS